VPGVQQRELRRFSQAPQIARRRDIPASGLVFAALLANFILSKKTGTVLPDGYKLVCKSV